MKGIITPKLAEDLVLSKYGKKFCLTLVGSVATKGRSYNDMDILISYFHPSEVDDFMETLTKDDWIYQSAAVEGRSPNFARFMKMVGPYEVVLDLYKKHYHHEALVN